jgi:hypothetical protein
MYKLITFIPIYTLITNNRARDILDNNKPVNVQQLIRPDRPNDTGGVHIAGDGYIPSIKIDDLNLTDCNLIQLDVEGYELNALLGGIKTIKKYKPVLCIEFCEKWLNRYNSTSENVLAFLKEINYIQVGEYGADKIFICNE